MLRFVSRGARRAVWDDRLGVESHERKANDQRECLFRVRRKSARGDKADESSGFDFSAPFEGATGFDKPPSLAEVR